MTAACQQPHCGEPAVFVVRALGNVVPVPGWPAGDHYYTCRAHGLALVEALAKACDAVEVRRVET